MPRSRCAVTGTLYCLPKKTSLFCVELDFLGHHISSRGIEADPKKVAKILNWPQPQTATEVQQFLGLVRYLAENLPDLAKFTLVLNSLTTKAAELAFPEWLHQHQSAFDGIKRLVTSPVCLTTINHNKLGENKIFLTTDASDFRTGAVLSWGPDWKSAQPVTFNSALLCDAELNYPVHKKELLAIIRVLQKWQIELLGAPVIVYSDHQTLQNFTSQCDSSRRQAHWSELMSQFNLDIHYIRGKDNIGTDALLWRRDDDDDHMVACLALSYNPNNDIIASISISDGPNPTVPLAQTYMQDVSIETTLQVKHNHTLMLEILKGYANDAFCTKLFAQLGSLPHLVERGGLLFLNNHLVIPHINSLHEHLFQLVHDAASHFGPDKSYGMLQNSFYWPNMHCDLLNAYLPSCSACMHNKSPTMVPAGPLHPLPIPDKCRNSVAINFIGPLPEEDGYNMILLMTDHLGADIHLVPCHNTIFARDLAILFFDHWFCKNRLPTAEIVSNHNKLFLSKFWHALHKLTNVSLKLSSTYHPESNGVSEHTNKTVNQCLHFLVKHNQHGWVKALPRVRFWIMNTVNVSTGFSPFQLHIGCSPHIIPPLISSAELAKGESDMHSFLFHLQDDVQEAQDCLLMAKVSQAATVNCHWNTDPHFQVGDLVMLSTRNHRHDYLLGGDKRVAKFMPQYDSPYCVNAANHGTSTYTLNLPASSQMFPTFHVSQLQPYHTNNDELFPGRAIACPEPVLTSKGTLKHQIDQILDER